MSKRKIIFTLIDVIVITLSITAGFYLRFDFSIPNKFIPLIYLWTPILIISQVLIFFLSDMYNRIWRFTSLFDLFSIIKSVLISSAISILGVFMIMGNIGFPRSVLLLVSGLLTPRL